MTKKKSTARKAAKKVTKKAVKKAKSAVNAKDWYVIIMAGGRGERFWPVSREKSPKQLITLLGKRSFLQQCYDRVAAVVPNKNIIIVTNTVQAPQVASNCPNFPKRTSSPNPVDGIPVRP